MPGEMSEREDDSNLDRFAKAIYFSEGVTSCPL